MKERKNESQENVNLSSYINNIFKDRSPFYYLSKFFKTKLWVPSKSTYLYMIIIFLLIYLITHFGLESKFDSFFTFKELKGTPFIDKNQPIYQNLITINSGIGAIVIALSFFVAQSLYDTERKDIARILLYKSNFFQLLTFETSIFLILLTGDLNYSIIAFIFILGVFVTYSLGSTIEVLIKKSKLESVKIKMLEDLNKDAFVVSFINELKRKASYVYLSKLEESYKNKYGKKITFDYIFSSLNKDYENFYINKRGQITDINSRKLGELISEILNKKHPTNKADLSNIEINISKLESNIPMDPIIVLQVEPFSEAKMDTCILKVKNQIFKDTSSLRENIQSRLSDIIITSNYDQTDSKNELLYELKNICIKYIEGNYNSDDLRNLLSVYLVFIDEYYSLKKRYHRIFVEYNEVLKNTLFFDANISILENIFWDLREIIKLIISISNIRNINTVLYISLKIITKSIDNLDSIGIVNFEYIPIELYKKGISESDRSKIENNIHIKESWMFISNFYNYLFSTRYIEGKIQSAEFLILMTKIIYIIQNLLKVTIDNEDITNLNYYLDQYKKSFDYKEYFLGNSHLEQRDTLLTVLNQKNEPIIGLISYILLDSINDLKNINILILNKLLDFIKLDIKDLTNLYLSILLSDKDYEWGWTSWEFNKHKDGVVFTSKFDNNIDLTYIVFLLRNKEIINADLQIEDIFPLSKELSLKTSTTGNLLITINDIISEKIDISKVLKHYTKDTALKLRNLFIKYNVYYNKNEKSVIRKERISIELVHNFKNSFLNNYNQFFGIRDVLKNYNLITYNNIEQISSTKKKYGIQTFFDKSAFIENENIQDIYWSGLDDAFDFGQTIKIGENNNFIKKIEENLEVNELKNVEQFIIDINNNNMIILSTNLCIEYLSFSKVEYIQNWNPKFKELNKYKDMKGIEGLIINGNSIIPVFNIMYNSDDSEIMILDVNKLGELIQYSNENQQFEIKIIDTLNNIDLINSYIKNPPDWLREIGNEQNQEEYLYEKVLIEIFEVYDFDINTNISGCIFTDKK